MVNISLYTTMKEKISIEKAIWKGHKMITFPVMIIIVSVIGFGLFLEKKRLIPSWSNGVTLVSGISLGWLYWSFIITKWRIWAFERVENIEELKRQAIEGNLIWKDGSIFEKTEIRTAKQKEILKQLNKRIDKSNNR